MTQTGFNAATPGAGAGAVEYDLNRFPAAVQAGLAARGPRPTWVAVA